VELLQTIPSESVDLVITDPPYESLEKWRTMGTTTRLKKSKASSNEWFEIFPNSRFPDLFRELYRVLRKGTHLYLFCDEETRDVVKPPIIDQGFKYWKALVWDKQIAGMGYHYRAQYEFILMAEKVLRKGKHRRLNDPRPSDVLSFKRLKGKRFYPTEKPADLIELLVAQSTQPGDRVLDPFCGSGVVGQVCEKLDRHYIISDIDPSEAIRRLVVCDLSIDAPAVGTTTSKPKR
jgi:site-specific DNA-methyltransferase (adenine-specific)